MFPHLPAGAERRPEAGEGAGSQGLGLIPSESLPWVLPSFGIFFTSGVPNIPQGYNTDNLLSLLMIILRYKRPNTIVVMNKGPEV